MRTQNGLQKGFSASSLRMKASHPSTSRTLKIRSRWSESRDLERSDTAQISDKSEKVDKFEGFNHAVAHRMHRAIALVKVSFRPNIAV